MTVRKLFHRDGYRFQTVEDFMIDTGILGYDINTKYISLDEFGWLLIRDGYAWDGASFPAINTLSFRRGSLIHDALYQLIRLELINANERDTVDLLLRAICIEDGMTRARAWMDYRGLRRFGGAAADPANIKPVLVAP